MTWYCLISFFISFMDICIAFSIGIPILRSCLNFLTYGSYLIINESFSRSFVVKQSDNFILLQINFSVLFNSSRESAQRMDWIFSVFNWSSSLSLNVHFAWIASLKFIPSSRRYIMSSNTAVFVISLYWSSVQFIINLGSFFKLNNCVFISSINSPLGHL